MRYESVNHSFGDNISEISIKLVWSFKRLILWVCLQRRRVIRQRLSDVDGEKNETIMKQGVFLVNCQ
ncbi:hypothetical protein AALP_AA7G227100 [Arabis alpina]|uniref:Uncharacterized protein n=1 Tax=Arabis alpina TaxID=50452 RepID=A0A087GJX0_ARAAL|nr:hypothetical protein AALP_AA7G227100 [Arabis alpina]